MKIKILVISLLLLAAGGSLSAQGFRFDSQISQEALTTQIPGLTNVLTIPSSASIAFCTYPANAVPCTNKATTYTTITLGTPCLTSTQIVLVGTTTCVASPDAQGNWGVWVAAGNYAYTISIGGLNFGPYVLTLGTTAGTATNATNLVGPGTVTGNYTHSGGTENFTGPANFKNVDGIRFVDTANLAGWAGSDCFAWLASAVADLGAAGGKVVIGPGVCSSGAADTLNVTTNNVTVEAQGSWRGIQTMGATILRWTGGALPIITVSGLNDTLKGFSIDNTGTATIGVQLNASVHFVMDDVAIAPTAPSTPLSSAGLVCSNAGGFNSWVLLRRSYIFGQPIGVDCDHTNLFTATDSTTVRGNTSMDYRFGNLATDFGVFISTGADIEVLASGGNAAIGINFINVVGAVVRDTWLECGDVGAASQVCIKTGPNALGVTIDSDFFTGSGLGNFAINAAGGTGIDIVRNKFYGFLTAGINNSGPVTSGGAFNNYALNGTPQILNTVTGFGVQPDKDKEILGSATTRWNAWIFALALGQATSSSPLPSTSGAAILQMAKADTLSWRNNANTGNLDLGIDGTDRLIYNSQVVNDGLHPDGLTIASGTSTLTSNAALGATTSQAAITTAATGAATTDSIEWSYASAPGAGDSLCIVSAYATNGNVNFVRSNPTAAAQNVSAIVINWRIVR